MNRKITFCLIAVIILAAVVMNLLAYPKLPDRMACHWGPGGQPDNWVDKSIGVWVMPAVSMGLSVMFFVILLIDPLRKNIEKFFSYYAGFIIILNLFLLAVHGWMLLWNTGVQIPANVFIPIGMACLIFYLGIVTSRVKPNWFIGIRTPWTLSNELVWQKTHKLGGVLFRIAAIIMLVGAVFPKYAILFVLIPVLSVAVITTLYSLWLAMGQKRPHKKHLSIFFVILLLACMTTIVTMVIHSMLFPTPAFAEAVAPLLNAKNISFRYRSTIRMADTEVEQPTMLCIYQAPFRMRIETPDDNSVMILDVQGKMINMLMLSPEEKTAMKTQIPLPVEEINPEDFDSQDLYTAFFDLREMIIKAKEDGTAELLGETIIDGQKVVVYRICDVHNDVNSQTTLWIEENTFRPVRTQSTMTMGNFAFYDKETDFVFNQEFAPDFFSLVIPEGYTEVPSPVDFADMDFSPPDEESLIDTFRLWAEYTDGHFPSDLSMDYVTEISEKLVEKLGDPTDANDTEGVDELVKHTQMIAAGIVFAQMLPESSNWHYNGKDAVFGDAETPIFWYRPQNASAYRVIYADLRVKDIPANQLPTATN